MKKLSFLSMALLAGSTLSAQTVAQFEENNVPEKATEIQKSRLSRTSLDRAAAIFYEDFANGLAGNNGVGSWTAGGTDAALWMHDFDGPDGAFSNTDNSDIIGSETVANGFMMFDTDLSHGNGSNGYPNRDGYIQTPVLNLSAEPSVVVSFYQGYRWCCTNGHQLNLLISTDGGSTFPNAVQLNAGASTNVAYDGAYTFNVTQYAANQSQVVFRFAWGSGSASHYYWQIDDVSVDAAPADDLEMVAFEAIQGDTATGRLSWALGQEPADLATSRWFMGIIRNNADNSRDVYLSLDIDVNGNLISVENDQNTTTIAGGGALDTIFINYTPASFMPGNYAVTATAMATNATGDDASPANNVLPSQFSITYETIATNPRNYVASRVLDNQIDTDDDGTDESHVVDYYNRWVQFEEVTIRNMATAFSTVTEEGAKIQYGIYGTTESGAILDNSNPIYVGANLKIDGSSNAYDAGVEAGMIGVGRVVFPFQAPIFNDQTFETELVDTSVTLPGDPLGIIYAAGIRLPDDAVAGIIGSRTGFGQGNRQSSLMYGPFDTGGALATYLSSAINVIEIGRDDETVSVTEIENRPAFYLAQNRPNPFNNGTTIVYQLNKKSNNISFEVYDVTGKQVMSLNQGSKGAGQYAIELDGSEFTTGLYYYSLTVNGQKLTRKMVVTE